VLNPLLNAKLRILKMMIVFHCFPLAKLLLYMKRKRKVYLYKLSPASCNAGMCRTPSFEAIHVVPKKQTQHKAIGNPTAFIFEKAVRILDLTL
jgi:hypothetical protein